MSDLLKQFIKWQNEYEMTLPRKKRKNVKLAILKHTKKEPLRKRETEAVEGFIKFLENKLEEELK